MFAKRLALRTAAIATMLIVSGVVLAQTGAPTNNLPNAYQRVGNWAKMPAGRFWGAAAGVDIDPDGKSVWVAERCGQNSCAGSNFDPILKFDASGKLEGVWPRDVRLSARHQCGPRRKCVGDRRPGQGRHGAPGDQVQPRWKRPDAARQT